MEIETVNTEVELGKELTSIWKGSKRNAMDIAGQIQQRWGQEAAKEYHPEVNCFTFNGWQQRGYRVKKGEKAMRASNFVKGQEKVIDKITGQEMIKYFSYPKDVCLFFIRQVEKTK